MAPKKAKSAAKEKRQYERDEPVSLHPLDLRTALAGLMGVRPKPSSESPSDQPPASDKPSPTDG